MKKHVALFFLCIACSLSALNAKADPGPYDAYFSTDPCDVNGADSIMTPCHTNGEINIVDTVNYLLGNAGVITPFVNNTDLDAIQLTYDHSYWTNVGDASLAFISISAGGFNIPGVYEQGNPGAPIFLNAGGTGDIFFGDGSFADPYPGIVNPFSNSLFGTVITHDGTDYIYSDPTLNADQFDHMLAFDLRSYLDGSTIWIDTDGDLLGDIEITLNETYLVAFEDKPLGSAFSTDHDYNDSIYLMAHVAGPDVHTTPIPEPATGLLLLGGFAGMTLLKRKNKR